MEIPEVLAWMLFAAIVAFGVYWAIVIGRVHRTMSRVIHVKSGGAIDAPRGGWPTVSIVVPVHNEERVIDRCLRSLRGQDHPDLQIIIVLDRCTDATERIARAHAAEDSRILLVENRECPPDWAGKCNAARAGAERATGEWILFTDADVRLDPSLVRSSLAIAMRDQVALLSLVGRLTSLRGFERLAQPVASLTLMRIFPLDRVSHPTTPRAFANGQFMLFRRADYDAVGGHHAVRDDLLEDLAFARAVQRGGRRLAVLVADDLLEVSMYDSFKAFRRGWRRILIEACARNVRRLHKNAVRIAASGLLPPPLFLGAWAWLVADRIGGGASLPVTLAAVAAFLAGGIQAVALAMIYRRMGVSAIWIAGYPLGAVVVALECLRGAADLSKRRPVRWGGREYVIAPR